MTDRIRVAVVDDHPIFREGVAFTIRSSQAFEIVAEGASADDAIRIAKEMLPDVILLDVSMPGGGIEAARVISTACPGTLRWLARTQTAPSGCFRPVGSRSFGREREHPLPFDQQPLEAWASISAYLAAWRIEGDAKWVVEANRAFDWFSGGNDLRENLIDAATGGCCDGLHPDRKNLNQGAESCLSYLHSLVEMREMQRLIAVTGPRAVPKLVQPISAEAATPSAIRGGYNVAPRSPEAPNLTFAT